MGGTLPRDNLTAPSPSGKAEVCKTSISGSNPDGASTFTEYCVRFCAAGRRYAQNAAVAGPACILKRFNERAQKVVAKYDKAFEALAK